MATISHQHSGPGLFARYAYPPNALGYCGPADHETFLDRALAEPAEDLIDLIGRFDNLPYLRLIAGAAGIADPLDPRVVEAYWVGNDLLVRVPATDLLTTVERFARARSGASWDEVVRVVGAGAVPHHSFHVLAVYPWLDLLRRGLSGRPLEVLDRCRIRWGTVESVEDEGEAAIVRSQPLEWDGHALSLGRSITERVTLAINGKGFVAQLRAGETVALHWDWVCDRLTGEQLMALHHFTALHLGIVAAAFRSS